MIEIKPIFTPDEAITILQALGFDVRNRKVTLCSGNEEWTVHKWMVRQGRAWTDAETVFRELLEKHLKAMIVTAMSQAISAKPGKKGRKTSKANEKPKPG